MHCSKCGATDPDATDGYTDCCDKRVCDGEVVDTWTYRTRNGALGNVAACCSHDAIRKMPTAIAVWQ